MSTKVNPDNHYSDPRELYEALLDSSINEKLGDYPKWLKIKAYQEEKTPDGVKSEMLLNIRGRDYWFPLTPDIYNKFLERSISESRGSGLIFLRNYIKENRGYKGRWPDEIYYSKNRISNTVKESAFSHLPEPFNTVEAIASNVGLDPFIVDSIVEMKEKNYLIKDIASTLGLSVLQVESVLVFLDETLVSEPFYLSQESIDTDIKGDSKTAQIKAFRKLNRKTAKPSIMRDKAVSGFASRKNKKINLRPGNF
jgi:hypothetical protein